MFPHQTRPISQQLSPAHFSPRAGISPCHLGCAGIPPRWHHPFSYLFGSRFRGGAHLTCSAAVFPAALIFSTWGADFSLTCPTALPVAARIPKPDTEVSAPLAAASFFLYLLVGRRCPERLFTSLLWSHDTSTTTYSDTSCNTGHTVPSYYIMLQDDTAAL